MMIQDGNKDYTIRKYQQHLRDFVSTLTPDEIVYLIYKNDNLQNVSKMSKRENGCAYPIRSGHFLFEHARISPAS